MSRCFSTVVPETPETQTVSVDVDADAAEETQKRIIKSSFLGVEQDKILEPKSEDDSEENFDEAADRPRSWRAPRWYNSKALLIHARIETARAQAEESGDVQSYNELIEALANHASLEPAALPLVNAAFEEMKANNLEPDINTYISLLKAHRQFAREKRDGIFQAFRVWKQLDSSMISITSEAYEEWLEVLAQAGRLHDDALLETERTFKAATLLFPPTLSMYHSVLRALGERASTVPRFEPGCEEILLPLKSRGLEIVRDLRAHGMKPDRVTYRHLFQLQRGLAQLYAEPWQEPIWEDTMKLCQDMVEDNVEHDSTSFGSLLRVFRNCMLIRYDSRLAMALMHDIRRIPSTLWTPYTVYWMMRALTTGRLRKESLDIFREAQRRGIVMSEHHYNAAMMACKHSKEILKLYVEMRRNKIKPNYVTNKFFYLAKRGEWVDRPSVGYWKSSA